VHLVAQRGGIVKKDAECIENHPDMNLPRVAGRKKGVKKDHAAEKPPLRSKIPRRTLTKRLGRRRLHKEGKAQSSATAKKIKREKKECKDYSDRPGSS